MAHLTLLLLILIILTIISPSHSMRLHDQYSMKSTSLTFYFHDTLSGKNQSAWAVVPPVSKSGFGSVTMFDDPLLMKGPEISSTVLGRAQGMYASADSKTQGLLMLMTFVFNNMSGYENSTLSVLGRNEVFTKVREMPVVGGTGEFRFASGYARAMKYNIDRRTAVVKYVVDFVHS